MPGSIKNKTFFYTDPENFFKEIFLFQDNVITPTIHVTEPLPIPNALGTIPQTEPLYGFIEFELENGEGLTEDELRTKKSEIIFSSNLRLIKNFRLMYEGLRDNEYVQNISVEDPNLDFIDEIYNRK